ncbi:MAG: ribbon-helix-helix protein, CopG family [Polyangiaceae bacterium]|nr:ribbon-helix-helix protein, CopG family [Polyangiaceae bacterium]
MSVSVTIDLPEDIAQLLEERCARTRHTQSQVVAELLRPALLAKETAPPRS